MSSPSHPFAATFCTSKLNVIMVIAMFLVIGRGTAAPNIVKTKAQLTEYAFYTPGHSWSQSQKPGGVTSRVGQYEVPLPDGRTQIVTYTADERGYIAKIRYEQTRTVLTQTTRQPLDRVTVPSSSSSTRSQSCNTLPNPGECRGAFPRVFFNSTSSQCDCYLYGGCDDEEPTNSWLTLEECSANCSPDIKEQGPRCKIASKPEVERFTKKPYKPSIAEVPDTSNLSDDELLRLFDLA